VLGRGRRIPSSCCLICRKLVPNVLMIDGMACVLAVIFGRFVTL
jgi:hypothetical protein